jgi:hypothetical protein
MEKKIRELKSLLGPKTIEVELFKEAVKFGRGKKTDIARALARSGGFALKVNSHVLGVWRPSPQESSKRSR